MKHLDDVNLTYWEHLKWALCSGVRLTYAGLACTVHSLLPFLFQNTASGIVYQIHHELEERRCCPEECCPDPKECDKPCPTDECCDGACKQDPPW